MKRQGQGLNNAANLVALAQISAAVADPPAGVKFSHAEMALWISLSSARVKEDWRAVDLFVLVKIVQLETKISHYEGLLTKQGPTICNSVGTPMLNPVLKAYTQLQAQQYQLMRGLSLTQAVHQPATLQGRVGKAQTYDAINDEDDLYRLTPRN